MIFNVRRTILLATAAAVAAAMTLNVARLVRAADDDDDDGRAEARCSNRTIRGDYGFTVDGQILAGPRPGILRGVTMTRFDGQGGLSQVDFATINGIPISSDWRPATGSYSLNADCTGKAEFTPNDGSPTVHLRFVVADRGRQIRTAGRRKCDGERWVQGPLGRAGATADRDRRW